MAMTDKELAEIRRRLDGGRGVAGMLDALHLLAEVERLRAALVATEAVWRVALRDAQAAEREACAAQAESKCAAWDEEGDGESIIRSQALYGMADAGREIAERIRARSTEVP